MVCLFHSAGGTTKVKIQAGCASFGVSPEMRAEIKAKLSL